MWPGSLPCAGVSYRPLHQNHAEIINVGSCRARDAETADPGKEPIAIVVRQHGLGIQALCPAAGKAARARTGARIVFGSVAAVRIAADRAEARVSVAGAH